MQLLGIIGRRRFRRRRTLGVVEAGLIAWGAASLAGVLALGGIHASGGFARVPADADMAYADDAARLAALAAPPPAPLPRARPPEPMFTGSIPAAVEARHGLLEAVRHAPKGGLVELRRRYQLTKPVAAVTEPVEDWDGVEQGSWDGETPPAPADLLLGDAEAIQACEEGLRAGLPIPSSLKRVEATTGVYRAPGDDAVVTFDFEAVNGFGYPLALQAHCVFDGYSLADLDMVPR